jgi:hypothetical protein
VRLCKPHVKLEWSFSGLGQCFFPKPEWYLPARRAKRHPYACLQKLVHSFYNIIDSPLSHLQCGARAPSIFAICFWKLEDQHGPPRINQHHESKHTQGQAVFFTRLFVAYTQIFHNSLKFIFCPTHGDQISLKLNTISYR